MVVIYGAPYSLASLPRYALPAAAAAREQNSKQEGRKGGREPPFDAVAVTALHIVPGRVSKPCAYAWHRVQQLADIADSQKVLPPMISPTTSVGGAAPSVRGALRSGLIDG